ncbi:MAG: SGNH/GDSL hydrolase family protein [Chloroflexi bacterium]|nr:SGNH/GDSL hydrolase family protein [Chloroflexota bacterium]
MANWSWLENPAAPYTRGFALRVIVKAALLLVVLNVVFALLDPLPALGRLSLYNVLFPGRVRLPYGENPAQSYNLSLMNLPAMLAAHEVARPKAADEYRVFVMGDSSIWGILLKPDETLSAQLNALNLTAPDGRRMRFYNLGHPVMALLKDLMLLDTAMRSEPDMIVWAVTLQSFPRGQQLYPPLVQHNAGTVRRLIQTYDLNLSPDDPRLVEPSLLDKTIVGRRRDLADLLRLQLYGVAWGATGIDQFYPRDYDLRQSDFDADESWQGLQPEDGLSEDFLAFDVIDAFMQRAGDVPVLLVNEPIYISSGQNSDLRYNFWYPRWAYDAYRVLLKDKAQANGWPLLDVWDAVAPDEFTDSPVHMTPAGTRQLAEAIRQVIEAGQIDSGNLAVRNR